MCIKNKKSEEETRAIVFGLLFISSVLVVSFSVSYFAYTLLVK